MRILALGLALAVAGCNYIPPDARPAGSVAAPQEAAPWRPVDAETGKIRDVAELQVLATDFPDSGSVHLRLLQAYFAEEDTVGVVREALWLAERGYSFSEGARKQIVGMAGETAVADKLSTLFERNVRRIENSTVVDAVPAEARLVESVTRYGDIWLASSIVSRDIFVGEAGSWKPLDLPGAGSLTGLAVDEDRSVVWIASGRYDPTPDSGSAYTGLIGYRPLDGEYVFKGETPRSATPSDMHLADDGTLYTSAPISGEVFFLGPERDGLDELVPAGTFRSPQGLATSADGKRLYVSDYRYGIAVIDLAMKKVRRLRALKPMMLDGIDGLWRHGDKLIGVQNGQSPMRIVEITLSADGYSATDLRVLEQAHSGWTEPLGGSIHNGALYYVATGQWDRFAEGGAVKEGKEPGPTEIRRLPLD